MMPLACSGMSPEPTIPHSTKPCQILRLKKPPQLTDVCLSTEQAVQLAIWIFDVEETRVGLEGCPLVQLVDE